MEEKRRNFFIDIWTSIRNFEGYEEFAADKVTTAIKYLILLTMLFTILCSCIYVCKFYFSVSEFRNYSDQNIEEIKLENRKITNKI